MSIVKAYEVKSLIYSIDEDYDSALFYIGEAIQHSLWYGQNNSQIESPAGMLLDASEKENENKLLMEAKSLILQLEEGDAKYRLTYEMNKLMILQKMVHDNLQD